MRHVSEESFALTLWTWGEIRGQLREDAVQRLGERTDLAGQIAIAFHNPQDLQKMEMRYLKAAGQLSQMFEETKSRLSRIAVEAANAKPMTEE